MKASGVDVLFVRVDVGDEKSVENLVSETVKHYGRVDVMVNKRADQ